MLAYIKKEIKFFILIINNVIKIFMVGRIIYLIKIFMQWAYPALLTLVMVHDYWIFVKL